MDNLANLINNYKTSIPNKVFNELKDTILDSADNLDSLNNLDEKLDHIINKDLNPEKYYSEIKGALKTDIVNRVTGLAHNVDGRIREPINKVLNNTIDAVFNDGDVTGIITGGLEDMKNATVNTLVGTANSVISGQITKLGGKVISHLTEGLYAMNDPTGSVAVAADFINNTVNSVTSSIQGGIQSLLTGGTVDGNILNNIGNNFQHSLNSIKSNLINSANNYIAKGIDVISDKLGADVSGIFSLPTISIDEKGLNISGGGLAAGAGNAIGNIIGDKIGGPIGGMIGDAIGGALNKLTDKSSKKVEESDSLTKKENIKKDVQKDIKDKNAAEDQKAGADTPADAGKPTSVEDRNDKPKEDKKEDPDEPKPEEYDNEIPPRAEVKQDPRRDNCQELVMWEMKGEEYVLLRDGLGNYLILDEAKKNIRLQHISGSFLEMRSNGDIVMSSARHVLINCEPARYIKRF